MSKNDRTSRKLGGLPAVLLVAGALAAFLFESLELRPQLDDAYISYRYARNLIEGQGLVFNPGEYVEGFVCLLWVLLVTAGMALGYEGNQVGHFLGLASGVIALLATYFYACNGLSQAKRWLAGLAPWIVVASLPFAIWATSGMETSLYVAAVILTLAAGQRGHMALAATGASIATLTRPEGVMVAAAVFGFHVFWAPWKRWQTWMAPAAYGVVVAGLTAFRLLYYGAPLPNPFYAKVGGIPWTRGLADVGDFLWLGAAGLLIPAVVATARDRCWWPGAAFAAMTLASTVAIGGDVFPYARFLLPALPVLAVLGVRGMGYALAARKPGSPLVVASIPATLAWCVFGVFAGAIILAAGALWAVAGCARGSRRRWLVPAASIGLAAAALTYLTAGYPIGIDDARRPLATSMRAKHLRFRLDKLRSVQMITRRAANLVRTQEPPIRLLAAGGVGVVGYYSRLPIVDYLGLVDAEVARARGNASREAALHPAHHRSNADYLFSRKPDFILISKKPEKPGNHIPAALDIWAHPDLAAHYEWVQGRGMASGYRRLPEPTPQVGPTGTEKEVGVSDAAVDVP